VRRTGNRWLNGLRRIEFDSGRKDGRDWSRGGKAIRSVLFLSTSFKVDCLVPGHFARRSAAVRGAKINFPMAGGVTQVSKYQTQGLESLPPGLVWQTNLFVYKKKGFVGQKKEAKCFP
jgi:hypothetical protein